MAVNVPPVTNDAGSQEGSNTTTNQGNNDSAFSLDGPSIWEQPSKPQQQQPQQSNKTPDQLAQFNNYVQGLQFQGGPTSDMFQQALQTGDFNKVTASFNAMAQQIYSRAMQDSSRMFDAAVAKAVDSAVGQSRNMYMNDQHRQALYAAVPISKNPNMQPIVEAVYAQAMTKSGNDRDKAIDQTRKFFAAIQQQPHTAFGFTTPPAGSPSPGRGGSGMSPFDDPSGDGFDWMSWAK